MAEKDERPLTMTTLCLDMHMSCVVVGDPGVGKTTMLKSLELERFPTENVPAVADKFVCK